MPRIHADHVDRATDHSNICELCSRVIQRSHIVFDWNWLYDFADRSLRPLVIIHNLGKLDKN